MRRWLIPVLALLAFTASSGAPALAGGGCRPDPADKQQATGTSVAIAGCAFGPTTLFVTPGDTVTWKNADGLPHNVVGLGWGRADVLSQGQTFSHTFSAVGIEAYACTLHPGMSATVVVGDPVAVLGVAAVPVTTLPGTSPAPAVPLAPLGVAALALGALVALLRRRSV